MNETSGTWTQGLLMPRPGRGVCADCFNLTRGHPRCYACENSHRVLDAVLPISYSVSLGPLHRALAGYKRLPDPAARGLGEDLAAILRRFIDHHERCLAAAAGVERFRLVTCVPSSDPVRDQRHPLHRIVGELIGPTSDRHERLLVRSSAPVSPRLFNARRYASVRRLQGEAVLLIDDTWTTGASAQSAASALKAAGAGAVAALVIGRHINASWQENDLRLRALAGSFRWDECAICCARARPATEVRCSQAA